MRSNIREVCQRLGRNADEITLIGITKYADAKMIQEAIEAGLKNIGENKVQDAMAKLGRLKNIKVVVKHFVGHLQTNKVKKVVELFDVIQSVDSIHLAEEIRKEAKKHNKTMDVLIQVNTSGEQQKFGISKAETELLVEEISSLENIRVLGLMTIAPLTQDLEWIRKTFRSLRFLFDDLKKKYPLSTQVHMKHLSMGMTDDYTIALEEGANMLRIGRAIFQE